LLNQGERNLLMIMKLGLRGGVATTLNVMDNTGDSRATVLILYEPKSAFEENWAEAKVKNALRANASKSSHLIIDGTRVDDVRVYEDGIVPTVVARYGTGGGNVPMIFSHTQGLDPQPSEENSPTLRTGGAGMVVAYPIQATIIGRADTSGPQGKGFAESDEPMFTLTKTDIHAVAFDTYNQTVSEKNKTLNSAASDVDHTGAVWKGAVVRRLTPIECERLQGFPDNWTEDQADTHRYKQMGNAVAVPVVSWIVNRLMGASNDLD